MSGLNASVDASSEFYVNAAVDLISLPKLNISRREDRHPTLQR